MESLDAFLNDYSDLNRLSAPREFHNDFSNVEMYINDHQKYSNAPNIARFDGNERFPNNNADCNSGLIPSQDFINIAALKSIGKASIGHNYNEEQT